VRGSVSPWVCPQVKGDGWGIVSDKDRQQYIHGPEPVVLGDEGLANGTLASGALLGRFKWAAAASEEEQQAQGKCQSTGFHWCVRYSRRRSILRHT
jgi:hypothetical protein